MFSPEAISVDRDGFQTDQAYANGSKVDLSEEDSQGRTIPKPMKVHSCHLKNGQRMYCLTDLKGVLHNNGELYPEDKLGLPLK